MGNLKDVVTVDCKSFGKKSANFKKCLTCEDEVKKACQDAFIALSAEKTEVKGTEVKEITNNQENQKNQEIKTMKNLKNSTNSTTAATNAKIGKAQMVKDMIFSLARKAEYTRKELGQAIQASFPEYKNSTLSTYISDSFNVKYAGVTGCGAHRMLSYVQTGKKKIIVVR